MKRGSVVVSAALVFMLSAGAFAASVAPTVIPGSSNTDKTCAQNQGDGQTWIEFKIDHHAIDGEYTDGTLKVRISDSNNVDPNNHFSWESIQIEVSPGEFAPAVGVDAVIVKDGEDGANLYRYDPPAESFGDTDLRTPNNGAKGISHISFCYDMGGDPTPEEDPPHLKVVKFYDANANGLNDDGQEIKGWKINISPTPGDTLTPFDADVESGTYDVSEYSSTIGNWVATTPTSVLGLVLADGDDELVEFGNLCLGAGGGHTLGFWSNKNGQALIDAADLVALNALHLRNANGTEFNPANKGAVKSFLLSANATNMANMLSAQLIAMTLSVREGFVDGDALILVAPGTFATVNEVMADAEAALAADGFTPSGDEPNRSNQEALKNALDAANNNQTFVQAAPCDFSFEEQVALATAQKAKKHKRHRHGRGGRGR